MLKKVTNVCLILVVVFTLSSCMGNIDYQAYVKATLDAGYKGDVVEYAKLTKTTEESAKEIYEGNIKNSVDAFSTQFEAASQTKLTEDQIMQLEGIITDLLKSVSYETVGEEKADSSTYKVDVKVKPLTCMTVLETKITEFSTDFVSRLQNGEIEGIDLQNQDLSEEEISAAQQKAMEMLLQGFLDIFKEIVANPEYAEEETVTLEIKYDKDRNSWNISESDLEKIDAVLVGI